MIPSPLHPAVVHFPIVLAVLLPLVSVVVLILIRKGITARPAWSVVVALAGVLVLSSWLAVTTGEEEEEAVEAVVSEQPIHDHEEAAEAFFLLSGLVLAILAGGLVGGWAGPPARYIGALGSVVLLVAGYQVGHTGGDLVYSHGAAQAYVDGAVRGDERSRESDGERSRESHDGDDDHDDDDDRRDRRGR